MATDLDSANYPNKPTKESRDFSWLKVGMVAVGSAIAGGLAAAWYYRNTLTLLRQADGEAENSDLNTSSEISDRD